MHLRNNFRVLLLPVLCLALVILFAPATSFSGPEPLPSSQQTPSPTPSATPSPSPSAQPSPSPTAEPTPSPEPLATPVRQVNKTALHQALIDLTNPWTVMCVAAHPDDEDGTTLTVLRRKYGVHTVSLFSTYGEGGQNAVGPELYEELGAIRAQETIAASEIQGSEPHFLGLRDFGFSKTAEETFRVWGHDEALRRMVQKIRELRPDVIITNHDTSRGHGHHQATGRLILEAFDAAADPKRFPEQLQRVSVWQPSRLFVRYRIPTGTGNTPPPDAPAQNRIVTIDPNERNPMRGTIYAEEALAALQKHATQGPWPKTIAERLATLGNPSQGLPLIGYQLVKEAGGVSPLPEGAKNFLDGLTLNEAVRSPLAPPTIEDRPLIDFIDMPDRVLNGLIDWRRRLARSPEIAPEHSHRVRLIHERGNRAIAVASGITLAVAARRSELVPGVRTAFTVNLSNLGDRNIKVDRLSFLGWGTGIRLDAAELLTADTETTATVDLVTPATAQLTVPSADHLYDGRLFGERFTASADLEIEGAKFFLSAATNLPVTPAIEIKSVTPPVVVWTPGTLGRPWTFNARLANHQATPFAGHAEINASGLTLYADPEFQLEPHETRDIKFMAGGPPPKAIAQVQLESGTVTFSLGAKEVITSRHLRSVYSDANVPRGLRVGFLPSFDKTLTQSLAALGVATTELSVADIQNGTLDEYDTIIIDNRGYQAHPALIAANSKLLDRVRAGATLIVFYHKNDEWNPDEKKNRPQLAPYPIILGGDRVPEEDAPVKFLQPGHPLLNFPNRIRSADFDGWIQERGLYYPKEWDRRYQAILETADQGESPLQGGLLVARYGRGNYIYTSMVWYRQLGAGVPGAYRVFANMISYGYRQGKRAARPIRGPRQPAARDRVPPPT